MATTIIPSDLVVTITESYSLNGVDYGNTMTQTFQANGQVSQRVMSIAGKGEGAVFTDILALNTLDGRGQVVKANYKYFRIQNLDDSNNLNLRIYNGADYVYFQIAPSDTILLMNAGIDAATAASAITFADITQISGQSSNATAAVDIEFVIVTT